MRTKLFWCLFLLLSIGGFFFFFTKQSFYAVIPLTFSEAETPLVKVNIQNESYMCILDTGTSHPIYLGERSIKNIAKKPTKEVHRYRDFRGNEYEDPVYLVDQACLGDLVVKNIQVVQGSEEFKKKACLTEPKNPDEVTKLGNVGLDFFKGRNFLIDISNAVMIIAKSLKDLEKSDYYAEDFAPVPFSFVGKGNLIAFEVETEIGKQKLMFDTGATVSVIRPTEKLSSTLSFSGLPGTTLSQFEMNGFDFGEQMVIFVDITPNIPVDGILGMSFLKKHAVFLDFSKKIAYIYL